MSQKIQSPGVFFSVPYCCSKVNLNFLQVQYEKRSDVKISVAWKLKPRMKLLNKFSFRASKGKIFQTMLITMN